MISDFVVLANTLDDLLSVAIKIKEQSLLPDFVAFGFIEERKGFHDDTLTGAHDLNETIKKIIKIFQGDIQFTLTRILDTICNYRCIDICVKRCKGDYYSVLFANQELPDYFNFQLDTIISNQKIYMIRPQEGLHGLVVYRKIHKHLGGNTSFDENNKPFLDRITDKIINYAKEEMIVEWQN